MKNSIPHLIAIWLIITFFILTMENAFSQTDKERKMGTTSGQTEGPSPYVTGLTAGRARSLAGGVVGLISVIIGWRVRRRSVVNPGSGRSWTITALVLGLVAVVLSVVHLASTTGGFGTGGGKAGAIVALVLGLIGTTLNRLALRSRGK